MSKAFYAGTFNPFTIGHQSIVNRALAIFDEIIIGVGYNVNKEGASSSASQRAREIANLFASNPKVRVVCYSSLTTEAALANGANILLRGVRDCADFEYERNIAEVNRKLSGLETIIMFSLPELACVSSSMVRELEAFGADISSFLPYDKDLK